MRMIMFNSNQENIVSITGLVHFYVFKVEHTH